MIMAGGQWPTGQEASLTDTCLITGGACHVRLQLYCRTCAEAQLTYTLHRYCGHNRASVAIRSGNVWLPIDHGQTDWQQSSCDGAPNLRATAVSRKRNTKWRARWLGHVCLCDAVDELVSVLAEALARLWRMMARQW